MWHRLVGLAVAAVSLAGAAAELPAPRTPLLASALMDMQVRNASGQYFGYISDLVLDEKGGIAAVVLDAGGLFGVGDRRYVVPWSRVQIDAGGRSAMLDVSPERLDAEFQAVDTRASGTGGTGGDGGR